MLIFVGETGPLLMRILDDISFNLGLDDDPWYILLNIIWHHTYLPVVKSQMTLLI